ncbi:Smim13 [Phodopus roborovskii]|uniref:Smim13 protein n=1 Tax=Phodopus roborovskii TaxID=109678 RepID=A0AAU9ZPM4_PHORO|nr:Smim13 [Phodopus roborovskii]
MSSKNLGLTLLVHTGFIFLSCWYFVWHLFLSKFKFLRELVGDTGSQEGDHDPSGSETEEDPSASPHRVRSARQRRAPAEEGH